VLSTGCDQLYGGRCWSEQWCRVNGFRRILDSQCVQIWCIWHCCALTVTPACHGHHHGARNTQVSSVNAQQCTRCKHNVVWATLHHPEAALNAVEVEGRIMEREVNERMRCM
jgi:hypothetical protein